MRKVFWVLLLLVGVGVAEELSSAKIERLVHKGERIATTLCSDANLSISGDIEDILELLSTQKPCGRLSAKNQKALAYYLVHHTDTNQTKHSIEVPDDAKCPVCGMFVYKYPKWSSLMVIAGKRYYFDGVKDMMKYYIFDADFVYDRDKIERLEVSDFYTLNAIAAQEAYYVIGSDIFGPMGDELIPFESEERAKAFLVDHKGEKIVRFGEIDAKMVMALDGM